MQQHPEQQYLDILRELLEKGAFKSDRTGVGNHYLFCRNMRFSLKHGFPLLTTKKVYWKGVAEELLWFMKGDTNSKHLEEKNVNIWKGNTSRDFLDKRGLTYLPEGEMGCGYSHQWRNFGGEHPLILETVGCEGLTS